MTFVPTHTEIDSVGSEANSDLYSRPFTARVTDLGLTPVLLTATELGKRLGYDDKTIRRLAISTLSNRPAVYSLYINPPLLVLLDGARQVLRDAENQRYSILKKGRKGAGNHWLFAVTKPGPKFAGYIQQPIWEE